MKLNRVHCEHDVMRTARETSADVGDPKGKAQLFAFMEELAAFGWADGPNLRMEIRWGGGNVNRASVFAK
jgi:hypothetical protein